jgi:hypothetical protein
MCLQDIAERQLDARKAQAKCKHKQPTAGAIGDTSLMEYLSGRRLDLQHLDAACAGMEA